MLYIENHLHPYVDNRDTEVVSEVKEKRKTEGIRNGKRKGAGKEG